MSCSADHDLAINFSTYKGEVMENGIHPTGSRKGKKKKKKERIRKEKEHLFHLKF